MVTTSNEAEHYLHSECNAKYDYYKADVTMQRISVMATIFVAFLPHYLTIKATKSNQVRNKEENDEKSEILNGV